MKLTCKALAVALVGVASISAYAQQNPQLDAPFGASAAGEHHRRHHHHHCGGPTHGDSDGAAHAWHACGDREKPMVDGGQERTDPGPGA
ncbi:hypothetical protein A8H39_00320 [Paraburkholderia fungorum]|uniref:hypothetical protein n=1 Tax=Paraburkholderia fungorum TaxID=134537 RepID=UPI00048A1E3B|nr:hypothetical protein [Paraburkholderia fungorum]PNE59628.1 hypothetical protein A8H39_00320 [Paraburkholderia fungorum]